MYQDGIKVFSFNYTDIKEDPLPSSAFERIRIGVNMRGLYTDLQIFSHFMGEKQLSSWTSKCDNSKGDIFTWKRHDVDTQQVQ